MNGKAIVTIDIPVRYMNEIILNILKQGTINGPVLCIMKIDKRNIEGYMQHMDNK